MLPRSKHNTVKSLEAKMKELDLLAEFNTYKEIDGNMLTENKKEDIIHTMWVIVEKEKEERSSEKQDCVRKASKKPQKLGLIVRLCQSKH
jgi:hypothetical protein